ncbi:DUF3261 domain-containing protein [Colwellia sp. UCD-KL20]|uniref:DUF3261 domain-containing protein n=1 Tax=Colwellia sp. UCD-KL20 TaxID=1917165 RepID=UPI000970A3DF|nr:DUF3261 domain-containing protein [Colwellia sp. UCD-KL20]
MKLLFAIKPFALSVLIFMLLNGCASLVSNNQINGDFYTLQTVPTHLVDTAVLESLVFKNEQTQKLLTQVEFHEQRLNMVAMTYSGLPIIQAKWQYDSGLVELVSAQFNDEVILRIIRDIQWVKWPVDTIKQGLSQGYTLIESTKNNEQVREIKNQNKVLVKITYTSKHIVLQNIAEQYELVIEQLNDK